MTLHEKLKQIKAIVDEALKATPDVETGSEVHKEAWHKVVQTVTAADDPPPSPPSGPPGNGQ